MSLAIVSAGGILASKVVRCCDRDSTIWLLRLALESKPDDMDLEVVFELAARLLIDVRGGDPWDV
jgi:hypothetical protein